MTLNGFRNEYSEFNLRTATQMKPLRYAEDEETSGSKNAAGKKKSE